MQKDKKSASKCCYADAEPPSGLGIPFVTMRDMTVPI